MCFQQPVPENTSTFFDFNTESLNAGCYRKQRVFFTFFDFVTLKGKKVKLSLCLTKHHTMKTYWGSGGTVPLIL
jgi:hypothetical protein